MGRKISALLKIIGVTGSLCGIIATAFAIYAHYNPTSPSTQRYDSIFILARLLFLRTVDVNNTERGLLRTSLLSESIEERINVSLKELISSSVKLNSSLTDREI